MPNTKQKQFIQAVDKAGMRAREAFLNIIKASEISGTKTLAAEQYLQSLQSFMNACNKIILDTHIAYGESSDDIGFKQQTNEGLLPHTLN